MPVLIEEDVDLQGLGDGNGGFDICNNRESYVAEPGMSVMPNSILEGFVALRRSVPEKSRSGMLISLASFNLITSLQGSCNKGKTSFKHISDMILPSISRSWSLTYHVI